VNIASHQLVAIASVVWALSQGSALGADKAPPAAVEIHSPKAETNVEGVDHTCEGRIAAAAGKQWPVVLVKPLVAGQPYYVLQPVANVNNGAFFTTVYLGDELTPPKTRFLFEVLLAKDKPSAEAFTPGSQFQKLPDLPQSAPVIVTRSK
jgi:hypothetical protein